MDDYHKLCMGDNKDDGVFTFMECRMGAYNVDRVFSFMDSWMGDDKDEEVFTFTECRMGDYNDDGVLWIVGWLIIMMMDLYR